MRVVEPQLLFVTTKPFIDNISVKGNINENKRIYYLVLWLSNVIWVITKPYK